MDLWLCFTCPARFCELLPGDLGSSALFLQHLIGQVLNSFHTRTELVAVELDYIISETVYSVDLHIRYDAHPADVPFKTELLQLE